MDILCAVCLKYSLLLQFFQLILLEPFYLRTLKEIKTFTNNVSDIFFSDAEIKTKLSAIFINDEQ